jgi:hypothetical protein
MGHQVSILLPASQRGAAWATAIREAATRDGWKVSRGAAPPPNDQDKVVRLTSDVRDDEAASDWLVLTDDPQALWAAEAARREGKSNARDILLMTSRRLAAAARLADLGAMTRPASSIEIDLPGIGRVRRKADVDLGDRLNNSALALYQELPPPIGAQANWAPHLFSYPVGKAYEGGGPEIDLTGRARALVHGPYIELPPGVWRADIRFTMDPRGSPIRLRFDWGVNADFVMASPLVQRDGAYGLSLTRRWSEQGPAQVRVWVMQGVFDGQFEFQGCTVRRMADDAALSDPAPTP